MLIARGPMSSDFRVMVRGGGDVPGELDLLVSYPDELKGEGRGYFTAERTVILLPPESPPFLSLRCWETRERLF